VAYHLRRLTGQWAEDMEEASHEEWQQKPNELAHLFGHADEKENANNLAGKLIFCDADVNYDQTVIRTHNSIDRFTGGVRQGALYTEQLLYQPSFEVKVFAKPGIAICKELKEALLATFEDIKVGALPMGAGSGRGVSIVMKDESADWFVNHEVLAVRDELGCNEDEQAGMEAVS
jgi:hypothetical protein